MNYNEWNKIALLPNIDDVSGFILTGRTAVQMDPDTWFFSTCLSNTDSLNILDFGCGVGRNSYGMSLYCKNWNVTGYDSSEMLSRTNEYFKIRYPNVVYPSNVKFSSNWKELITVKFDVAFCSLVFQHIHEKDLTEYLKDFKNIKCMIVWGRRFNDDNNKNTWKIIEDSGFYPYKCLGWTPSGFGGMEYKIDGDLHEHMACFYKL